MTPRLTLVRGRGITLDAAPTLSDYRSTVVELPWPDFLGRRVLLAIDANGRIFDQSTAESEMEAQWLTDRMTAALEHTGPRLGLSR